MVTMTPEAVRARLRALAELSAEGVSPMPRGVDMSPAGVTARLRDMADVSELCRKLAKPR